MADGHRKARVELLVLDVGQRLSKGLLKPLTYCTQGGGDGEVRTVQHPVRLLVDVRVRMEEDEILRRDSPTSRLA